MLSLFACLLTFPEWATEVSYAGVDLAVIFAFVNLSQEGLEQIWLFLEGLKIHKLDYKFISEAEVGRTNFR